jgi:hypothetical protein
MASKKSSSSFSKSNENKSSKFIVTSSVCEECKDKCQKGIAYINRIKSHKAGNGVKCHKLS